MITKQIWKKIKKAKVVTLFRHVRPDGDASGSQLGLKYIIQHALRDKVVYCMGEESKRWSTFLGAVDSDVSDEIVASSLAIVLDVGDIKRVDDQRFLQAKEIIKIDHHIFTEIFKEGELEWIDTSFSATCEMVVRLAKDNRLTIPPLAAKALYTGLVTDSGRFLYSNVNSATFRYASDLVAAPVDMQEIYDYIYTEDEVAVRFKGYCQQNFTKTENGFAYNKITKETLDKFHVSGNFGAGIVNVLGGMKGVHVHAHFSDREEGQIKVELRSKGVAVNEVAARHGGGGHLRAAGALVGTWEEVDQIIAEIDELCRLKNLENV